MPTTAAGHRFWEESDPAKRKHQQLHLLKNAGIVGGLLLATVDTEGRPSLAWRAQHAPRALSHAANDLRRDAELAMHSATSALHGRRRCVRRVAPSPAPCTRPRTRSAAACTPPPRHDGLHSATDSLPPPAAEGDARPLAGSEPPRCGRPLRSGPLATVRRLCLALPEATERISHGEPCWFVRDKKMFAMFANRHHDDRLACWLAAAPGEQQALVADDRAVLRRPTSAPAAGSAFGWTGPAWLRRCWPS